MATIKGLRVDLPQQRSVFVGRRDGEDNVYVQFTNESAVRRFTLSREAAHELRQLLLLDGAEGTAAEYSVNETSMPARKEWQIIRDTSA